jgi:hypothetical protein
MGANQDVHAEAAKISVTNVVQFDYHEAGTKKALKEEMHFRSRFYAELRSGHIDEAKKGFYRKDDANAPPNDEDQSR